MKVHISVRVILSASLVFLVAALVFGVMAALAWLYPEAWNKFLPFYQLRPFHVSAALFWILSAAAGCIILLNPGMFFPVNGKSFLVSMFTILWLGTIAAIFASYGLSRFGGREYWEFPPILGIPLGAAWLCLLVAWFSRLRTRKGPQPLYIWMWSTGILFFFLTFLEQNLWLIPWFRQSYIREITIQWKANGAVVGSWNQMVYGLALYLMVQISGTEAIARNRTAFFFYLLGLSNLMFNWGHHIYNVPAAHWIRDVSYVISMTEWLFLLKIIRGFRNTLDEIRRLKHLAAYRFIAASEFWVFINLGLAIAMSVPAINRYTHGTHITVAHAMGTTIGINTMILLGCLSYIVGVQEWGRGIKKCISANFWIAQVSLFLFFASLVVAGFIKGYHSVALGNPNFQEVMDKVRPAMIFFCVSGIGLAVSLSAIALALLSRLGKPENTE